MTHMLSSLANGRIIVALEGGYNLTAIAYSMTLCTKALLGDPIPPLQLKDEIDAVAVESIRNVLDTHAEYWSVLKPFRKQFPFNTDLVPVGKYAEEGVKELANSLEQLKIDYNNLSLTDTDNNSSSSASAIDSSSSSVLVTMSEDNKNNVEDGATAEEMLSPSSSKEKPEPFTITVASPPPMVGSDQEGLMEVLRKMHEGVNEVIIV